MEAVKAISLSKIYPNGEQDLQVLDKVDFTVENGEFVAIVGASGSGKSTLLNLVGGLDYPTSGCVYVNGVNLSALTEEELTEFRRTNIGFVFQNYNLIPVLNAYENIVLPSKLNGKTVDEKFLERIVKSLGIEEKLFQMPGKMSGGQQQRVAIARALYTKPTILLADEPTGNLDSGASMEVIKLMKRMHTRFGQTIIVVTHDNRVARRADRIIRIESGKVCEYRENEEKGSKRSDKRAR